MLGNFDEDIFYTSFISPTQKFWFFYRKPYLYLSAGLSQKNRIYLKRDFGEPTSKEDSSLTPGAFTIPTTFYIHPQGKYLFSYTTTIFSHTNSILSTIEQQTTITLTSWGTRGTLLMTLFNPESLVCKAWILPTFAHAQPDTYKKGLLTCWKVSTWIINTFMNQQLRAGRIKSQSERRWGTRGNKVVTRH